MMRRLIPAMIFFTVVAVASSAFAEDWPQWRGIDRDGVYEGGDLMDRWPDGGPEVLWKFTELGHGFSSAAIFDGKIYITGLVGNEGHLYSLDTDGNLLWSGSYGSDWSRSHPGTRGTPTINEEKVYVMSGFGVLACVDAQTGKGIWRVNTLEEFNGRNITWGIAESVLIDDEKVFATPGGRHASMVALNRNTGQPIWRTRNHSDKSAYCSPLHVSEDNQDIIVNCTREHVIGVNPDTGEVYWKIPMRNRHGVHPNTPIYWNNHVFVTSGYDGTSKLIKLSAGGKSAKVAWTNRAISTHHGGAFRIGDRVYGTNHSGVWACIDLKTGKTLYRDPRIGKGSAVVFDGKLIIYNERSGEVMLVKPTDEEFQGISKFRVTDGKGPHWAHPTIANGVLYIRHGNVLTAYDIGEKP